MRLSGVPDLEPGGVPTAPAFPSAAGIPDKERSPLELGDLLQVAVGKGRHCVGGNTVAPDAGIDDSTLDVYAIQAGCLRDHLSVARLIRDGSLIQHDHVQHVVTRSLVLHTETQPFNRR